ncbi:MAG: DUF4340 domain-containing protein [Gammaproteobacteria bacterium]|nr:DUF4340 domain-containing protein [Gammaproteobacteria bacterium]
MSARTLLNLALALLAVLLAAIVWLRPGLEPETAPAAITALEPEQVSSINITRLQGAPLGFSRHDGTWFLDGDPHIPADAFQLRAILALLQATSIRSYPAGALDLIGLGLDPPQASVMFNGTRVAIGNIEPIDRLRYIKTGTTIHLVEDRYQHLLNAGFNNFVRRHLLPEDASIIALQLPDLTLTRTDGIHWQLTPEDEMAGADDIDALVRNWLRASALYVRRFEPGAYDDTISLTMKGENEPVVFTLISLEPDLVLARPEWGIQYHLAADAGAGLLSLPLQPAEQP